MTTQLKPPLWALILGVIGICVGAFGMLAGAQDLAMPYVLAIQKDAAARISASLEEPSNPESAPAVAAPKSEWSGIMQALLASPHWFPRYSMGMAILRMALGLACILASLALISVRPGADFHFMLALGLSAARNLTAVGMGVAAGTLFSYWAVASGIFGFFLDSVLVMSCMISNRSAYESL